MNLRITSMVSVLFCLFITSCNAVSFSPSNNMPLELKLDLIKNEVVSADQLSGRITLENNGNLSVLVHRRLYFVALPMASEQAEVLLLIKDSSGKLIINDHIDSRYDWPSENTMGVLLPGGQIVKSFALKYYIRASDFKKGGKYTIVAIYQNAIETKKTINGIEISSWIGVIRSNEETFVILP